MTLDRRHEGWHRDVTRLVGDWAKCYMDNIQSVIGGIVTQTSEWQLRFREPMGQKVFGLIMGLMCLVFGPYMLFTYGFGPYTPNDIWGIVWGGLALSICYRLLKSSLPHELHLNFHYRMYDEVMGFGSLSQTRKGGFDEINCVYVRRDTNKGAVWFVMGFAFGDTGDGRTNIVAFTRPCYDVVSWKSGNLLRTYAEPLAAKMGIPYSNVGW